MNQFDSCDGWRSNSTGARQWTSRWSWTTRRPTPATTRPLTEIRYYEWIHPLSDIVNALIAAGLSIDFLNEHDIVVWKAFPFLVETGEDQFCLPDGQVKIPLSFSIGATKREP